MSGRSMLAILILALAVVLLANSAYYVDQREKALVFKFGEIISSDEKPGLHWKTPFINNVEFFDARIQTMDANPELYLTNEKKNLMVDSFVKWRISNVAKYKVTVSGNAAQARRRLAQRVNDSLRREFGRRSVRQVISGDRAEIMDVVRKAVNVEAGQIGVEVVDVRLKRVDLVPAVSERVYVRMEAERSRIAKQLRARGAETAEKIQADADRQRTIILANARREAQKVKGQGDADAANIYAEAYNRDPEFYSFYRSINAYKSSFSGGGSMLVVDPSSEFFRYFKQAKPDAKPAQ
ncbi:MAG TPA: protease modulator HflC [Gammaproteobacteria bacterium]|nr:protease modulator HflC [Gammaproteobacteria bacterium]